VVAQGSEHPAYDAFWQEQALDRRWRAAATSDDVDPGAVGSGDMWGAIHSYLRVEPKDTTNDATFW
jgi:hypothetical protein